MEPSFTTVLLVALLVAGTLAWVVASTRRRAHAADAIATITSLTVRLEERDREASALRIQADQVGAERMRLEAASSRLAAELDAERTRSAEKLAVLADAEAKLRETFQSLSADALRQNNQAFLHLATESLGKFQQGAHADLETRQKSIDALVTPIAESLKGVDERIRDIEKEREGAYRALHAQVGSLVQTQQQLHAETANLVRALRTPNVRGRWGEMQLKRVVEIAGMLDHCDFVEQETLTTSDGRFRPDLIVRLPGGRQVIVDAKCALDAYLQAIEAPDDATRDTKLRLHGAQVREHMNHLGAKAYWEQFESTPEFVVMFLPGETFFTAALQHDPGLIEHGVDRKVIPASPITLIALLRAVAFGWRQEKLAENAQKISELGRELYDRLCTLGGHFARLKKGLDAAVTAYNGAVGSLETRVLVSGRKFGEYHAATDAELVDLEAVDVLPRSVQAVEMIEGPPGREAAA